MTVLPYLLACLTVCGAPDVVEEVAQFYSPFVDNLTRDIDVYTYNHRAHLNLPAEGSVDANAPQLAIYVAKHLARWWDTRELSHTDAYGLYAAIDPVASRDFGGDDWILLRMHMPWGVRFLDLDWVEEVRPHFPDKLVEHLEAAGCDENKAYKLIRKSTSTGCRAIAVQVMQRLEAQAFLYSWKAMNFRDCNNRHRVAWVLLTPDIISDVRWFTAETANHADDDEPLRLQALFEQTTGLAEAGWGEQFTMPPTPWPALAEAAQELPMADWINDHLMYCLPHTP